MNVDIKLSACPGLKIPPAPQHFLDHAFCLSVCEWRIASIKEISRLVAVHMEHKQELFFRALYLVAHRSALGAFTVGHNFPWRDALKQMFDGFQAALLEQTAAVLALADWIIRT